MKISKEENKFIPRTIEVYEDWDGDDEEEGAVILRTFYCPSCHKKLSYDEIHNLKCDGCGQVLEEV